MEMQAPKDRLTGVLDRIEMKVEQLRRDVIRIAYEQNALLSSIDRVKHSELLSDMSECDKDDIQRYAERILARSMTFEVTVRTERNASQKEALVQVNMYVDQLKKLVKICCAQRRCQTYINACTSQPDPNTGTDKKFESGILGCTLDDQKEVKERLQNLLDYFEELDVRPCSTCRYGAPIPLPFYGNDKDDDDNLQPRPKRRKN